MGDLSAKHIARSANQATAPAPVADESASSAVQLKRSLVGLDIGAQEAALAPRDAPVQQQSKAHAMQQGRSENKEAAAKHDADNGAEGGQAAGANKKSGADTATAGKQSPDKKADAGKKSPDKKSG